MNTQPITFIKGDRVIWDSNFGYDIGIFVGDSPAFDNYTIQLRSGNQYGKEASISKSQVHPYSEELIQQLTERYGYEHKFDGLTKEEAMVQLFYGNKIRHRYFEDDEWIMRRGQYIVFENELEILEEQFWADRLIRGWDDGYSIIK